MTPSPRWTIVCVALLLPFLGFLDFLAAVFAGNAYTVSAVLLAARARSIWIAICFTYSVGVFLGHVFLPSPDPIVPPTSIVIARGICVLAPLASIIALMLAQDGSMPASIEHLTDTTAQVKLSSVMVFALIIGIAVGRLVLPQHPFAFTTEGPMAAIPVSEGE